MVRWRARIDSWSCVALNFRDSRDAIGRGGAGRDINIGPKEALGVATWTLLDNKHKQQQQQRSGKISILYTAHQVTLSII
jgi:hypothetical protein